MGCKTDTLENGVKPVVRQNYPKNLLKQHKDLSSIELTSIKATEAGTGEIRHQENIKSLMVINRIK